MGGLGFSPIRAVDLPHGGRAGPGRRELNQAPALEAKHGHPAAHILQPAVGFAPLGMPAEQTGEPGPIQIRCGVDLILDPVQLGFAEITAADLQQVSPFRKGLQIL